MRTRTLALTAVLIVALLAAAGGVYAYDKGKDGQIAEGVKVNGVDVGGMSTAAARQKLRATLLAPLNRPVMARYEGHRFRLTPRQAAIGIDIDGSVRRALNRSRQGSMFSRAWREVRGAAVPANLDAKISFSRPAVHRLVARVQRT